MPAIKERPKTDTLDVLMDKILDVISDRLEDSDKGMSEAEMKKIREFTKHVRELIAYDWEKKGKEIVYFDPANPKESYQFKKAASLGMTLQAFPENGLLEIIGISDAKFRICRIIPRVLQEEHENCWDVVATELLHAAITENKRR